MRFTDTALTLALILGSFYTIIIGFGQFPINLQVSLSTALFYIALVVLLKKREFKLNKLHYFLLASSLILSWFFSLTTDTLLTGVNYFALFFVTTLFLQGLFGKNELPLTATNYAVSLIKYGIFTFYKGITDILYLRPLKLFNRNGVPSYKPNRETVIGVCLAFPILLVFHGLFASINSEYAAFMTNLWNAVWRLIRFIINIDFIWWMIKTLISSFVFFTLFTVREEEVIKDHQSHAPLLKKFIIVLVSTIVLFFVFTFFQTKFLFMDFRGLAFKTLSLYTQNGFWELVIVSILGYSLSMVILNLTHNHEKEASLLKKLLTVFTTELVIITLFSYHKLFWLQYLFGLKDQRILATSGVALITLTCILFFFRIWDLLSARQIFIVQAISFLSITLVLNTINLDLLVTRTYPISYYVYGKKYKDFSYLLGNSYDNNDEWLNLIREAKNLESLPPPENYYWGWYRSLCSGNYQTEYDTNSQNYAVIPTYSTYLERRFWDLDTKYNTITKEELPKMTRFNFHEYQAYTLITSHRQEFTDFWEFAKRQCEK